MKSQQLGGAAYQQRIALVMVCAGTLPTPSSLDDEEKEVLRGLKPLSLDSESRELTMDWNATEWHWDATLAGRGGA